MEFTSPQDGKALPRSTLENTTSVTPPLGDSLLSHSNQDDLTLSTIQLPHNTSKNSHNESVSLTRLLTRIRSVERLENIEQTRHNQSVILPNSRIPRSPTEKRGGFGYLPRQLRGSKKCSTTNLLGELKDGNAGSDLSILRLKAENLELKQEMQRMQEEMDVLRSSDVRYKAMVYDKLERVNQLENTLRGLDAQRKAEIKQKDALIRDLYVALEKKEAGYGGRSNRTAKTASMQELDEVSFMLSTVNISNELLESGEPKIDKDSHELNMIEWDREREQWHQKQHSLLRRIQELEKNERDVKEIEERYQRRISELEHFLKESKAKEQKAIKKMEALERCQKDYDRKFKTAAAKSDQKIEALEKQILASKGRQLQITQLERQLTQARSKLQLMEELEKELQEVRQQVDELTQCKGRRDISLEMTQQINEKMEGQITEETFKLKSTLAELEIENGKLKEQLVAKERGWSANVAAMTRARQAEFEKLRSTFTSKLQQYRLMLNRCGVHSSKQGGMSARSYEKIILEMDEEEEQR